MFYWLASSKLFTVISIASQIPVGALTNICDCYTIIILQYLDEIIILLYIHVYDNTILYSIKYNLIIIKYNLNKINKLLFMN